MKKQFKPKAIKVHCERPKVISKDRQGLVCQYKSDDKKADDCWLISARKKEDTRILGGEKMEKRENKKMYFRLSNKKEHIYGFVPEGGLKENECILITLKSSEYEGKQYAGLVAVIKENAEFTGASVLPPREEDK